MFKRPEELIMAVLAALWVVFTYFLASYFGAPAQTALLITTLTLIWAALFFGLWQRGHTGAIWPIFLGLLVACWWPFIDWYAISGFVTPESVNETIVLNRPWYDTWTAKIIWALIPTVLGYVYKWKRSRRTVPTTFSAH